MTERPRALINQSWSAGRGFESRWRHIFILIFFARCFPFRTAQRSQCKWNKAWPFPCFYRCFKPQIPLIMQDRVYFKPQYSFKLPFQPTSSLVKVMIVPLSRQGTISRGPSYTYFSFKYNTKLLKKLNLHGFQSMLSSSISRLMNWTSLFYQISNLQIQAVNPIKMHITT